MLDLTPVAAATRSPLLLSLTVVTLRGVECWVIAHSTIVLLA